MLKRLPMAFWDVPAEVLRTVEVIGVRPDKVADSFTSLVPKGEEAGHPIKLHPLTVLSQIKPANMGQGGWGPRAIYVVNYAHFCKSREKWHINFCKFLQIWCKLGNQTALRAIRCRYTYLSLLELCSFELNFAPMFHKLFSALSILSCNVGAQAGGGSRVARICYSCLCPPPREVRRYHWCQGSCSKTRKTKGMLCTQCARSANYLHVMQLFEP